MPLTATNIIGSANGTVGTTADTFALTKKQKLVVVRNTHATQTLSCKVKTGVTSAASVTAAAADPAVAGADNNFLIKAGETRTVFKSTRQQFVCCSLIGSGAATTFSVEGTIWVDGN